MQDEDILEILLDWNFWEKDLSTGITRNEYIDFLKPFLDTNQAISITGARRSGKSTIMLQLAKSVLTDIKPENILIVNLEDYRFHNFSLGLLKQIYELFKRKISKTGKKIIVLDEIHKIKGWEKFVRTLLDKKETKVIVSGSNSELISEEYASLLTGRHINAKVMPLSFKEILKFKDIDTTSKRKILAKKPKIKEYTEEYLKYGGFPEVVNSPKQTRFKILGDYFESIITKDVADRHNIRRKDKLKSLVRFYLTNISNRITFNKTSNNLNIPLGTVERFSHYLEESFLINFVKRFSFKLKEQEKAPRKVYSVDTGISNAIGFKFSKNIGDIMENTVFLEIKKKNKENKNEIYYWQGSGGKEVDFVIKKGNDINKLIQVCYDIENPDTKKREIEALLKASNKLKCKNLLVVTYEFKGEEKIKGKKIKFTPLWEWMLS